MALISTDLVKSFLKIDVADFDLFLTTTIDEIIDYAETYCSQRLDATRETTIYKKGSGTQYLLLPSTLVNSISHLYYRQLPTDTWTEETDTTIFTLEQIENVFYLYYSTGFFKSYSYKVIFNSGYLTTTLPKNLQSALKQMAAQIFRESGQSKDRIGIKSESKSNEGVNMNTVFDKTFERYENIFNHYRYMSV